MSTTVQTPGERASLCAVAVDAVFYGYAMDGMGDLAWGLHQLSEDASTVALSAVESGDINAIEAASQRYCHALAILAAIVDKSSDVRLRAAQGLMELTKSLIDQEASRVLAARRKAVQP